MSRAPQTPRTDGTPAGTNQLRSDIPVGRRFSRNEELLRIERELVADGVELDNRAIPAEYHAMNREYDDGEIAAIIEQEVDRDHPNRELIGYLNSLQLKNGQEVLKKP